MAHFTKFQEFKVSTQNLNILRTILFNQQIVRKKWFENVLLKRPHSNYLSMAGTDFVSAISQISFDGETNEILLFLYDRQLSVDLVRILLLLQIKHLKLNGSKFRFEELSIPRGKCFNLLKKGTKSLYLLC